MVIIPIIMTTDVLRMITAPPRFEMQVCCVGAKYSKCVERKENEREREGRREGKCAFQLHTIERDREREREGERGTEREGF